MVLLSLGDGEVLLEAAQHPSGDVFPESGAGTDMTDYGMLGTSCTQGVVRFCGKTAVFTPETRLSLRSTLGTPQIIPVRGNLDSRFSREPFHTFGCFSSVSPSLASGVHLHPGVL